MRFLILVNSTKMCYTYDESTNFVGDFINVHNDIAGIFIGIEKYIRAGVTNLIADGWEWITTR